MSNSKFTETELQQTLRDSENRLDHATMRSLATAREQALASKNQWFTEFRGLFSAGLVAAVLMVTILIPMGKNEPSILSPNVDIADENLQLLMEDPEFFLWVSNSYSSLPQ